MDDSQLLDELFASGSRVRPEPKKKAKKAPLAASIKLTNPPPEPVHPLLSPISPSRELSGVLPDLLKKHGMVINGHAVTDESFVSNVSERMLPLDNFFSGRHVSKHRSGKSGLIGARKSKNLYDIGKIPYPIAKDLHEVWKTYANRFIELGELKKTLCNIELLGAELKVVDSVNKDNIGVEGIVVRAGLNALVFISSDGRSRTLPKDVCTFRISVGDRTFDVQGKNFKFPAT